MHAKALSSFLMGSAKTQSIENKKQTLFIKYKKNDIPAIDNLNELLHLQQNADAQKKQNTFSKVIDN